MIYSRTSLWLFTCIIFDCSGSWCKRDVHGKNTPLSIGSVQYKYVYKRIHTHLHITVATNTNIYIYIYNIHSIHTQTASMSYTCITYTHLHPQFIWAHALYCLSIFFSSCSVSYRIHIEWTVLRSKSHQNTIASDRVSKQHHHKDTD